MAFTGAEFYARLSELCKAHGTSVTALLLELGKPKSLGWSIQKSQKPNRDVAEYAARKFGVPSSWLLGFSDVTDLTGSFKLNNIESELITKLRLVSEDVRHIVLIMLMSALDFQLTNTQLLSDSRSSLSPKGIQITQDKTPDRVLGTSPKLRSLGVGKGVDTVAYRRVEGRAAAGRPIAAVPEDDRRIVVPVKYTGEQFFIVQADGDSMTGLIENGDFGVFDKYGHFDDGRPCLIQADGATDQPDVMIKRVYRRGDRVELRSDNRKYQPFFYPAREVKIMGELVAVLPPDASAPPLG